MSVAELEVEVLEYKQQLDQVIAGIQADPDNSELQNLRKELEEFISLTESSIAELKPASVPAPRAQRASPPKEKWSKENHPAYQSGYRRPGSAATPAEDDKNEQAPVYKVNDTVMAKWKSGDKAFYPAKITSITGSSSKPVYIVTFKGYNNTETLFSHEIRPQNSQHAGQKRKADEIVNTAAVAGNSSAFNANAAIGGASSQSSTPGVISAAPTVDPAMVSAARNTSEGLAGRAGGGGGMLDGSVSKPAKVPKKISNTRALEGAKSKWQEFSAGGKGKMGKKLKKESMFKTGEGVNARVGFTGSGQAMRKDQARTKHIYDKDGDDEY